MATNSDPFDNDPLEKYIIGDPLNKYIDIACVIFVLAGLACLILFTGPAPLKLTIIATRTLEWIVLLSINLLIFGALWLLLRYAVIFVTKFPSIKPHLLLLVF